MASLLKFYPLLILILFLVPILCSEPDFSFASKEIIENDDLCLKRPYWKTAEPFYFLPVLRAKLYQVGDKFSFPSRCFKKNIVSFKEMSTDKIVLTLQNQEKIDTFCSELFIFHTADHNFLQFIIFQGEHDITLKYITQDDKDEIKVNGIKLYGFCSGFVNTIKSALKTFKAYYGGMGYDPKAKNPRFRPNIPKDMEKANLRILELFNHYTPERRNNTIVNFDKSIIKTGDAFVISRMDLIDPMIMIGSGGHVGHCVVAAWKDNELYILEAQDALYWPRRGIQKNKWEDWVKWANTAEFNVVHLPLRDEYRNKLNADKAWAWFENEMEGLPYGYHNFVFSWIDTEKDSFPFITTNEFEELFFSLLSKFYPAGFDLLAREGLNFRLNTTNLNFQQIITEAARKGLTFEQLMAIPEKEGLPYHDGVSYTCSCFVTAFWEHGDMFGDIKLLPNEFTPRDLYTLDVYDKNFQRPQECIDDNPDLPYCQVTGKFILELDNYSTVKPYSNMNERCPSIGPDFIREDGC